jgi:hypothetical protein
MSKKPERPVVITPRGELVYPHLNRPDDRFDKENPKYTTKIRLKQSDEDVQKLMQRLDQLADEAFDTARKENAKDAKKITRANPYEAETDDAGNDTGNIIVKAAMKASYKDKKTGQSVDMRPALKDAKRNDIDPSTVRIGGGTEAKLAMRVRGYYVASQKKAGITLDLNAVQILKLVEYNGGGGNYFAEEDGFEAEDDQRGTGAKPAAQSSLSSGEDDDGDEDF